MHSELAEVLSGMGLNTQLKGAEVVKKGVLQEEDPLLVDKSTLPTGVFAVHVYGCQNLYLDANFPPEHFGIYVQITVGSMTRCTSLQSPFKKGRVVWDEIKNFSLTISSKVASPVNKVTVAVIGFDKLQPIPKHKLLGKTEFHLHKLAKKQWSMETFELQNRKKQYAGDLQLEIAFAYGIYGYGLCDQDCVCTQEGTTSKYHYFQRENDQLGTRIQPILLSRFFGLGRNSITPRRTACRASEATASPHAAAKKTFTPPDSKSRPHLQQNMSRLSQLYSDYSLLTTRSKRIDYLKQLLQEKDVHGVMPGEPESDSEGSSMENLGDVTQFGLTGALAQMANMTFLAGAPELIQEAEKQMSHVRSAACGETDEPVSGGDPDVTSEVPVLPGFLQDVKPVSSPSVSNAVDGGETSGESPSTHQKNDQITPDDNEHCTDSEAADIKAAMASRGRRYAVVVPRLSNTRKSSIGKRGNP